MTIQEILPIAPTDRQLAFEQDWAERHNIPVETLAQYRHRDQEGYKLPDIAKNFRTWCNAQSKVVVMLPAMNPAAGRLVTTLAKSMHAQYVKAIEAAGIQVQVTP